MRMEKIRLQNYRCFRDRVLELGASPIQVYLAPNGLGKSALIDGFASLLGLIPWAVNRAVEQGNVAIQHHDVRQEWSRQADRYLCAIHYPAVVEGVVNTGDQTLTWGRSLNTAESNFNEKKGRAENLAQAYSNTAIGMNLPLVARYTSHRVMPLPTTSDSAAESPPPRRDLQADLEQTIKRRRSPERWHGYEGCMSGGLAWSLIRDWWLVEELTSALRNEQRTAALTSVCEALKRYFELPQAPRFDVDTVDVMVQLQPDKDWFPVSQLSDGYRISFSLVTDIARRAAMLNPHLGESAAAQTEGIILIDEIDLHLHPSWQREVLERLHRTFPAMQFIVTTHAPQIVIGAGDELASVAVLERDEQGEPLPSPVTYTPGQSSDDLLTSRLFKLPSARDPETEELISKHAELFRALRTQPELRAEYEASAEVLRERLHLSMSSSLEMLVFELTAELAARMGKPTSAMTWEELQKLRARALEALGQRT